MLRTPEKAGSDSDIYKKCPTIQAPPSQAAIGRKKRRKSPECTSDEKIALFEDKIIKMFANLQDDIDAKFKRIESKLSSIHKNTGDIEKSLEFLSERFEEITLKVQTLEKTLNDKQSQIEFLEEKMEDLQRSARSSTLEIRNVPNCLNETKEVLSSYILEMSSKIGVNMTPNDIKDIFRIPGKADTNKPIIAELTTTMQKNRVIKGVKSFNIANKSSKLNAFHLGIRNQSSPVFVVEHLTSKANRLHYLARELLRSGQFKYCWTSNGKVFLRKVEGSPIVLIKNEEQLTALKSPN